MLENYWLAALPAYLLGLVLSRLAEWLLAPRPVAPWRRPAWTLGVHVGLWTLMFGLELALFHRPYFGAANVLAIQLLIILVSNAKQQALEEPFIFQDFEYFLDAIKHPRLYLPFFGLPRALMAAGAYGLALWAGLAWEPSMTRDAGAGVGYAPFFAQTALLAALGLACAQAAGKRGHVDFNAVEDLRRLGLAAALWAYGRAERQPADALRQAAPFAHLTLPPSLPDPLPDLVVIQSESFFDARRVYPQLKPDILANFDRLKAESVQHGTLSVAARGANTVRTEFGFLSGMAAADLGVHQYNPYRRLAQQRFPTLVWYLKRLGYRTICVHPYHRGFYRRDVVLPLLGFDQFIGIEAFGDAARDGPYVGDRALGERVLQILDDGDDKPTYIHVITMENHGPLHWETVTDQDAANVLQGHMPAGCQDLVAYARHLRNADAMMGSLTRGLRHRRRASGLCWFGDHIPIMPTVYRQLGAPCGYTDYLVWLSDASGQGTQRVGEIAGLAVTFLETTGLSA